MENSQNTIDVDRDKDIPRNEESVNQAESLNVGDNPNVEEGNKKDDETNDNNKARRSWVWQHFTYVKGAVSLNCPYCKTTLKCDTRKNGTGSLANHLKTVCRKSPAYSKNKDSKKQSLLGFKVASSGESGVANYTFSQEKCRRALARMCIKDNRPFSIVDDEGFKEYSWEMNPLSSGPPASQSMEIDAIIDLESSFWGYLEQEGNVNKPEVERYLSDGIENRSDNLDVLQWWKINSLKFPILSQVARHVLGMPISTVASESAFSTGGRVIDPFRSSLTPKTAEALIYSQDWIRSSPADLELPDVNAKAIEELQDKLEKIEMDEFSSGPKFFAPCMHEE